MPARSAEWSPAGLEVRFAKPAKKAALEDLIRARADWLSTPSSLSEDWSIASFDDHGRLRQGQLALHSRRSTTIEGGRDYRLDVAERRDGKLVRTLSLLDMAAESGKRSVHWWTGDGKARRFRTDPLTQPLMGKPGPLYGEVLPFDPNRMNLDVLGEGEEGDRTVLYLEGSPKSDRSITFRTVVLRFAPVVLRSETHMGSGRMRKLSSTQLGRGVPG